MCFIHQAAFNITITESPLRNILLTNRSLGTATFFFPLVFLVFSVQSYTHWLVRAYTHRKIAITHLFDVLQHHIRMSVKGPHRRQQLMVVSTAYEHLCAVLYRILENTHGPIGELVLFQPLQLSICEFISRTINKVSAFFVSNQYTKKPTTRLNESQLTPSCLLHKCIDGDLQGQMEHGVDRRERPFWLVLH